LESSGFLLAPVNILPLLAKLVKLCPKISILFLKVLASLELLLILINSVSFFRKSVSFDLKFIKLILKIL